MTKQELQRAKQIEETLSAIDGYRQAKNNYEQRMLKDSYVSFIWKDSLERAEKNLAYLLFQDLVPRLDFIKEELEKELSEL